MLMQRTVTLVGLDYAFMFHFFSIPSSCINMSVRQLQEFMKVSDQFCSWTNNLTYRTLLITLSKRKNYALLFKGAFKGQLNLLNCSCMKH